MLQCLFLHTVEINGYQNCLFANILQNVYLYVSQKNVSHTVSEQREGE